MYDEKYSFIQFRIFMLQKTKGAKTLMSFCTPCIIKKEIVLLLSGCYFTTTISFTSSLKTLINTLEPSLSYTLISDASPTLTFVLEREESYT